MSNILMFSLSRTKPKTRTHPDEKLVVGGKEVSYGIYRGKIYPPGLGFAAKLSNTQPAK